MFQCEIDKKKKKSQFCTCDVIASAVCEPPKCLCMATQIQQGKGASDIFQCGVFISQDIVDLRSEVNRFQP